MKVRTTYLRVTMDLRWPYEAALPAHGGCTASPRRKEGFTMANVPMNALTRHLEGKVGDMVFRTVDGRVSASLRPKIKPREPSASQIGARLAFRKAITYANSALANPTTRAIYERAKLHQRKPIFSLAVGDYFKPPIVDEIDLAFYA